MRFLPRKTSALVVPVPVAQPVADLLAPPRGRATSPPVFTHVTVLYPFLPPRRIGTDVLAQLAAICAEVTPFAYGLRQIGFFPDVVYLAPEPADKFRSLTEAVTRAWPGRQPYGGRFDSVIPHVTVADRATDADLARVKERLPLEDLAREMVVIELSRRRWERLGAFPFASH